MGLKRASLAAALVAVLTLGACDRGQPVGDHTSATPQRIVAVAPSVTEILFTLGLGERVVAVGDYSSWPAEAVAKPKIGGLFNPRLEEIVALKPDLAVLVPSEETLAQALSGLGIEILVVQHETLDDVEHAVAQIAARTGVEAAGQQFVEEFRRRLEPRARRDGAAAPKALFVVAREPGGLGQVTAVGSGTFLAELAARLDVENVFSSVGQPYPQVSLEEILLRGPELIVELQPQPVDESASAALLSEWSRFPQIPAVASGCLRVIGGGHVLLPGPRLPRLMAELEEALDSCRIEAAS